ncbi:MAG: ZIP family metal transporter [Caldimonas sp.]
MDLAAVLGMWCGGLATGVGGLGVLLVRRPSQRTLDALLGFTCGVMLAATGFSLLVPALDAGGLGRVLVGFAVGGVIIVALDRWVPHLHARMREGRREPMVESTQVHRAALLMIAMTIHNFPEGAAVGTAFAAGGTKLGLPIAVAIATQNLPEGFAVAAPLLAAGASRPTAVLLAFASGIVEPVAAFGAFGAFELLLSLLPYGLAFAAARDAVRRGRRDRAGEPGARQRARHVDRLDGRVRADDDARFGARVSPRRGACRAGLECSGAQLHSVLNAAERSCSAASRTRSRNTRRAPSWSFAATAAPSRP